MRWWRRCQLPYCRPCSRQQLLARAAHRPAIADHSVWIWKLVRLRCYGWQEEVCLNLGIGRPAETHVPFRCAVPASATARTCPQFVYRLGDPNRESLEQRTACCVHLHRLNVGCGGRPSSLSTASPYETSRHDAYFTTSQCAEKLNK
jgi:hypothetical protein